MSITKNHPRLGRILALLFVLGIGLSLAGRSWCENDTSDYRALQPELQAPDIIDTVLFAPGSRLMYVCYNDSACVNVYTEEGVFCWGVSAPWLRHTDFFLRNEKLYIYNHSRAYVYDSGNGAFLGETDPDTERLPTSQQNQCPPDLAFDQWRVWREGAEGTKTLLVQRPWWHRIFHFLTGWCIAAVSALVMITVYTIDQKKAKDTATDAVVFDTRKERILCRYCQVTTWVHVICGVGAAVANFLLGPYAVLIIFPLGFHLMISSWIVDNMIDRLELTPQLAAVMNFWKTAKWVSLLLTALLAIGSAVLVIR